MELITITKEEFEKIQRIKFNQKKANQKYIEKNREHVNERSKQYYKEKLATNPDHLAKKREYSKQYYLKKKLEKQMLIDNMDIKIDEIYVQTNSDKIPKTPLE
jgi:hypothetical protein